MSTNSFFSSKKSHKDTKAKYDDQIHKEWGGNKESTDKK